jgi:hypothetical protein
MRHHAKDRVGCCGDRSSGRPQAGVDGNVAVVTQDAEDRVGEPDEHDALLASAQVG